MVRVFIQRTGDSFKILISTYTSYYEALFHAEEDIDNYVNNSLEKFRFGRYILTIEDNSNVLHHTHFNMERTN